MTSHLTSEQACHTLPPVQVDYTPKGITEDKGLDGIKTYVIKASKGKAIIFIYDIFGYSNQLYQGADLVSSAGYDVFIPDFFEGKPLDKKRMATASDDEKKDIRAEFDAGPGNMDAAVKRLARMSSELKEAGYSKVAAAGFCWGGNVAAQCTALGAQAMIHPGRQVNPESAEQLTTPTCLLPSQNEDEASMEGFHAVMKKKPFGDKCVLKWYRDMPHGWTSSRADFSTERGKEAWHDAFEVMTGFFDRVL